MGENTRLKKGAWTSEEDERLSSYIRTHGRCTWRKLPIYAGLNRCGKSCRLRWMNYLRPDLKRGSFTKSEEELILISHDKFGTSWSKVAAGLPGRSDNEIKNYWHTHLKEKSRKRTKPKKTKSVPKPSREDNMSFTILESSSVRDLSQQKFQESSPVAIVKDPRPKEVYLEVEAFPLPELEDHKIMLKAFDQLKIDEEVVIMKNQVTDQGAMSSQLDWSYWNDEFRIDEEFPVMENESVGTSQMAILAEPCLELDPDYVNELSILYQNLGFTF